MIVPVKMTKYFSFIVTANFLLCALCFHRIEFSSSRQRISPYQRLYYKPNGDLVLDYEPIIEDSNFELVKKNLLIKADRSVDWNIGLLSSCRLHEATDLVISAHHEPLESPFGPLGFVTKAADNYFKNNLYNDVLKGFLQRSYYRLQHPNFDTSEESVIFAAYDKNFDKIYGVVEVYPTAEPYLCNLSISPNARRQGLAKLLCLTVEEFVMDKWDKFTIRLNVRKDNKPALKLYEKLKYKRVKGLQPKYARTSTGFLSGLSGPAELIPFRKELDAFSPPVVSFQSSNSTSLMV